MCVGRRHALVGIVAQDTFDDRADVGASGNNGGFMIPAGHRCVLEPVEAQFALAGGGVGTVTRVAIFRQDRLDVIVEGERGRGGRGHSDRRW